MTDESIFATALEKRDPAERAAALAGACGDDIAQRQRVERLLAAHDQARSFLDKPAIRPEPGRDRTRAYSPGSDADPARSGALSAPDDALGFLTPSSRPDSLGRIGHYEVLEALGRGGFGIVFRAFDEVLQRVVAVKVLAPHLAATSPARKRFIREAQSSAPINHENVVHIHEVGEHPLPYLVMEFVPGETLQHRLDRTGPLDVPEVLRIGRQVAEGLAAAHAQGLIHRDIKPANVLIESGPAGRAKLSDFGLARAADDASNSQSGIVAGTPMFMAPEQALGESLDHRADLFSLGSMLYTMLTGHPPFRAPNTLAVLKRVVEDTPRPIRDIIPEVPEWLCRVVEKLLAKDPAGRFQSAREVADLLADCEEKFKANGVPRDSSRIPVGKPPARRRRKLSPGMLVVVVLVMLLGLGMLVLSAAVVVYLSFAPVKNDGHPVVGSQVEGTSGSTPPADTDGWVRLFNGTDLTGWKPVPGQPGDWKVEGGELVGRSPPGSYLISESGDFEDVYLRAEVKLNDVGNSGVFVRSRLEGFQADAPTGYEADLTFVEGTPGSPIGTIWKGPNRVQKATKSAVVPDQWFTLEVIAFGPRVQVRVNGNMVADNTDIGHEFRKGHIALQALENTVVRFRKIEVLPLEDADASPAPSVVIQLGRDVVVWAEREVETVKTKIEVGTASRVDLVDAQIRLVEARILLAQHERDRAATAARLEELVALREEEKGLTAVRVDAGMLAPNEKDRAESRLAEAKVRLAQARARVRPKP
jgi:serine/threonine protein kinase